MRRPPICSPTFFGPRERDEHVDPHLAGGWDPDLPCPARTPGRMTLADLALLLDAPVEALRGPRPAEHVWHVSVRNAPTDRVLSDAEWAEVGAEMVHAAGVAEHGDEQACRWIAVRHAHDHVHLLTTLARQDGRHPRVRGDILKMHTAARAFEARWGLTPMSPLDRTAKRRPVTGEVEKAARRGLVETARESLQRTVRQAAALAATDADFLDRLRDAGLRVRERRGEDGALVGYAVALPGDRADGGMRPVWFAGSPLAYDPSLPRVRERFEPVVAPADWARAEHRIREACALLGRAGQAEGAGDVAALGDLLAVAVAVAVAEAPVLVRDRVQAAADAVEPMKGADWPVMARQLIGLQQAGVANGARTKAEGTDRWADHLRSTMPEGLVRDAILASPAWPDIAAAMGSLDAKGIDVARSPTDAHAAGVGVDQAVTTVTAAAKAPAPAPNTPAATAAPAPAPVRPTLRSPYPPLLRVLPPPLCLPCRRCGRLSIRGRRPRARMRSAPGGR